MGRQVGWDSWKNIRQQETLLENLPKGGDIPWALFYPANYAIASSGLALQHVWRALRRQGVMAERFFTAPAQPYRSLENDTLLERFPIITASVAYENELITYAKWLNKIGIKPARKERNEQEGAPLIGAGGSLTYINPQAFSSLCDFIVMGDAQVSLAPLIETLRGGLNTSKKLTSSAKQELLQKIAEIPHILVPEIHLNNLNNFSAGIADNLSAQDAFSAWLTPLSLFGETLLVQIQSGCRRGCKFCTLPNCFGPVRRLAYDEIKSRIEDIASQFKIKQIGLITPEAGDYPDIENLLEVIKKVGAQVSFASLRIDSLTEAMIEALREGKKNAVTLAPEAGSDRMRQVCTKFITNEQIVEKAVLLQSKGIKQLKLYFMLGLPGEDDGDAASIGELTDRILKAAKCSAVLSVNAFVPKPRTPWQDEKFIDEKTYQKRIYMIKERILSCNNRKKIIFRFNSYKEALCEYSIAHLSSADDVDFLKF